jgi:hypothetical protein
MRIGRARPSFDSEPAAYRPLRDPRSRPYTWCPGMKLTLAVLGVARLTDHPEVWNNLQRGPPPCYSVGPHRGTAGPGETLGLVVGKVAFQSCIREGPKLASKRLLTPNFHGDPR